MDTALRDRLKLKSWQARGNFQARHPHAASFLRDSGLDLGRIREHSAKLLAASALGGALLLAPGQIHAQEALPLPEPLANILTEVGKVLPEKPQDWLVGQLGKLLPPIKDRLGYPFITPEEEKTIGRVIELATKIPAAATLEGEHLNTVYGYTGYEQHLKRYPADTLEQHNEALEAGMAPGLGAWGYFTEGGKLTEDTILREKYYMVVQTLYLPDWNARWRYLRDWYKWRKIIMVNVENGNAAVGVIGDAGPAAWTGKHFGGSPEVMNFLGGSKYRKGLVLVYFVDDPENKIPLGPIDYSKLDIPVVKPI